LVLTAIFVIVTGSEVNLSGTKNDIAAQLKGPVAIFVALAILVFVGLKFFFNAANTGKAELGIYPTQEQTTHK